MHSIKHSQKIVQIENLKIGGENVLYRHEKTFINPTAICVLVDCSKPHFSDLIRRIENFGVNILNKIVKVDLIILKDGKDSKYLSYEDFLSLKLDVVDEKDFEETKNYLICKRKKAILEKDESSSDPVCVKIKNDDLFSQCARASYYLCKYANVLLFENFAAEMFSALFALRANIFTDPQKTLQVDPGLYRFNNPDKNAIVFMTTNFALTFFAVSNELQNLNVPSYLIVLPSDGMSVLTAWSAETFNAEIVSKTLKELDIKNKINTRKIIIPGLLGDAKEELNMACSDFEFIEGTREASEIGEFVKNLHL